MWCQQVQALLVLYPAVLAALAVLDVWEVVVVVVVVVLIHWFVPYVEQWTEVALLWVECVWGAAEKLLLTQEPWPS